MTTWSEWPEFSRFPSEAAFAAYAGVALADVSSGEHIVIGWRPAGTDG